MLLAMAAAAVGLALGAVAPAAAAPVRAAQPGAVRQAAVVTYWIELKTGNVDYAGTDGDVYIRLLGDLGTSGYLKLDNPGDDRERNQLDTYGPFYLSDLGALQEVRVAFYLGGDSPHWYLDYVTVDPSNRPKDLFPCYCWFTKDENKHLDPA